MAPFDRSYMTFYWSAIVSMLYVVPFSTYLPLNNRDLEKVMKVIQTGIIRKIGCGFLFAYP